MTVSLQPFHHDINQRALAAGYDPNRVVERLAYGSFVSPARRYMFVETPKAACTSFKHLIAEVEGLAADPEAPLYQRETRADMLIHQRRHFALPTLMTASAEARTAILTQAPGWMIFALVRNPFSRLVSFFEHKIRMGEPGYERMEARYGDAARQGGPAKNFARFIHEVVADRALRNMDVHMLPQSAVIMPRLVPYTHVFRLEAVDDAVKTFGAHLGRALPALRHNRTAGRDWRSYYDGYSAQIVADIYEEDFSRFGYDAGDWLPRHDMAPAPSSPEEYWRGEVVSRNQLIQALYDRLGTPPANSFVEKA